VIPPSLGATESPTTWLIKPFVVQENLTNTQLRKLWINRYTTADQL
jgi:hypothetical protein